MHTFRRCEMDYIPVLLEHVDFFNRLYGLDIELLERGLQFLVIRAGRLVDLFGLPSWRAFPTADTSCQN